MTDRRTRVDDSAVNRGGLRGKPLQNYRHPSRTRKQQAIALRAAHNDGTARGKKLVAPKITDVFANDGPKVARMVVGSATMARALARRATIRGGGRSAIRGRDGDEATPVVDTSGRRFLDGELFTHRVDFPQGIVQLQAMVRIDREARVLRLWDVAIGPVPSGRREVGAVSMRAFFASICELARTEGFDTMIVEGYRVSGANPDRALVERFDCRSHGTGSGTAADDAEED